MKFHHIASSLTLRAQHAWVRLFSAMFILWLLATAGAQAAPPTAKLQLEPLGVFKHGAYGNGAAEIAAYDRGSRRLFVVNADSRSVDILDLRDPSKPALVTRLKLTPYGHIANSVAVHQGVVAAAVEANPKTDPGRVVFFDANGRYLNSLQVGALPDALVFSPDGKLLLVANEGEPNDDYTIDPEGSVSVIEMSVSADKLTQQHVKTLDFRKFHGAELDPSIRIFGPGATVAQDLEPEYIAVSADSKTAWVTLQENNAMATIDLAALEITGLVGLGFKDHAQPDAGFDASDKSSTVEIRPWPVRGMYQPDAIAAYEVDGQSYLVLANEGDSRDYPGYSEESRVADLKLDPKSFPNASELQRPENLGRLKVTRANGDRNGDRVYRELYAFGGRSFSIRDAKGKLLYDSGDSLERITHRLFPQHFNTNDRFKDRSDDKGPEPEGVTVGQIDGRWFAFLGLERTSAVMVFDVTDPRQPAFQSAVQLRDAGDQPKLGNVADIAPEGLLFIAGADSPVGIPLLVVTNEVSGTTRIYQARWSE